MFPHLVNEADQTHFAEAISATAPIHYFLYYKQRLSSFDMKFSLPFCRTYHKFRENVLKLFIADSKRLSN